MDARGLQIPLRPPEIGPRYEKPTPVAPGQNTRATTEMMDTTYSTMLKTTGERIPRWPQWRDGGIGRRAGLGNQWGLELIAHPVRVQVSLSPVFSE